jgi:hypothetical protein
MQLLNPNVLAASRLDPQYFCEHVLRSPNDPWQNDIFNAVADISRIRYGIPTVINHKGKNQITIRAGHGPGKTHFSAKLMHWFNFVHAGRIVVTAPKQEQLKTRTWPEFRKILRGSVDEYKNLIHVDMLKIVWYDDVDICALAETGQQPENLAGHHEDNILVIVDEASGVNEEIFPVVDGMLSTGTNVVSVYISNPTKIYGAFADSHRKPGVRDDYFQYHVTLDKAPRVSREWVNKQIRKYGENSQIVKVRCFGEFAANAPDQLIPFEYMVKQKNKPLLFDGSTVTLEVIVDVSDGGKNDSVLAACIKQDSGAHFAEFKNEFFFDPECVVIDTAKEAIKFGNRWAEKLGIDPHDVTYVVDSVGVGAGCAGFIHQEGYTVFRYKGGVSSVRPREYSNMRTQCYCAVRDGLRDGWLTFSETQIWDDIEGQLATIKRVVANEKMEEIETKKNMLARGVESPDIGDVIAMGMYDTLTSIDTFGDSATVAGVVDSVDTSFNVVEAVW